jgi:hypothetical protein
MSRLIPPITLLNTRQTVHDLLLTGKDLDESSTKSLVHGMDDLDVDVGMYSDPVPAGARPKQCHKRDVTMIVDSDSDNSTPEILDQRPAVASNQRKRAKKANGSAAIVITSESEFLEIETDVKKAKGPGGRPCILDVNQLWVLRQQKQDGKGVCVCKGQDNGCPQIFERRGPDQMLGHS